METIYWIQRLGALNTFFSICAVLSLILLVGLVWFRFASYGSYADVHSDKRKRRKYMRLSAWAFCVFSLLSIFIPSEKDLYVIYGVGGTIDYIKSNDTAKQLPDKVVNALDAWIDKEKLEKEQK